MLAWINIHAPLISFLGVGWSCTLFSGGVGDPSLSLPVKAENCPFRLLQGQFYYAYVFPSRVSLYAWVHASAFCYFMT